MAKGSPTKYATDGLHQIPLIQLLPSPTNPRKHFDAKELTDLAGSIKEKGVLEPLLVRLAPQTANVYEIVCGERRYRASEQAKVETVPCIVRELNDQQVLEIQVVENMQRQDLSPLEEAQGYKLLHELHGYSFEDLAAKIGKSQSYIYGRLKLIELSPKVQKALAEGKLQLSWAVEFTRIQSLKDQEQLVEMVLEGWSGIDDLGDLRREIEEKYLLRLAKAPFNIKDAKLCPEAGACSACPKRTGAQPDIFGDSAKTDTCQDSKCWNEKVEANKAELLAKAKAGKIEVISGPGAAKAIESLNSSWGHSHYVEPTKKASEVKGKLTWAQATGGKVEPVLLLDPETGKSVKVYRRSEALAAVPASKLEEHAKSQTPEAKKAARAKAEKERQEEKIGKLELGIVGKQVFESAAKLKDSEALSLFCRTAAGILYTNDCGGTDNSDLAEEAIGVGDYELPKKIQKAKTPQDLKKLMAGMLFFYGGEDEQKALATACGVDLKKAKAEALKQFKEIQAQPKVKPKKDSNDLDEPEEDDRDHLADGEEEE
jgi:ParB/RepB/Spo0J family partition protein